MGAKRILSGLCVAAIVALICSPVIAGDADKAGHDQAAMMEAWQKNMTPGEHHAHLKMLEGKWTTTTKAWMDPTAEPMVSTGTNENTMILGGRYLKQDYSGDMMGMPFTGFGLFAYDNQTEKLKGMWVDNMSTGIMFMEGSCEKGGKTTTMWSEHMNLMGKMEKMRMVTEIIDENKHVYTHYVQQEGGKEVKMMEITYTRM